MARETAIGAAYDMANRKGVSVYVLLLDGSYFLSTQLADKLVHRVALIVGVSGLVWVAAEIV